MSADPFARQSRVFECILGSVAGLIGAALLLFGGFGAYRVLRINPTFASTSIFGIAAAIGLLLLSSGLRLIQGKPRSDGGLFSPWVLRLGGLMFLLAPILFFVSHQYFHLIETGFCVSAGIACFVLANRRTDR
jgi:uncharacterized membrane protein YqgA involved in biofilm formation